jgi:biotin synthase-like enzyme
MGDLLQKMFRINYDTRSLQEIEAVAEGAALMQEQHARDFVSLAETAGLEESDERVQRAAQVVERLR